MVGAGGKVECSVAQLVLIIIIIVIIMIAAIMILMIMVLIIMRIIMIMIIMLNTIVFESDHNNNHDVVMIKILHLLIWIGPMSKQYFNNLGVSLGHDFLFGIGYEDNNYYQIHHKRE